jgi:hypothetical protein
VPPFSWLGEGSQREVPSAEVPIGAVRFNLSWEYEAPNDTHLYTFERLWKRALI